VRRSADVVLPGQDGSGVRLWEAKINMLLGGVCGKARGWGGHGVRHGRRRKQRPLR
jgi:hypothetical protein